MAKNQDTSETPGFEAKSCPDPPTGEVYEPCCGSGGMFFQADELLKAHAVQKLMETAPEPPPKP